MCAPCLLADSVLVATHGAWMICFGVSLLLLGEETRELSAGNIVISTPYRSSDPN